jgi:hypothetical protein
VQGLTDNASIFVADFGVKCTQFLKGPLLVCKWHCRYSAFELFIVYLHPALALHLFVLCPFALTSLNSLYHFNLRPVIFSFTPVGWLRSVMLTPNFWWE